MSLRSRCIPRYFTSSAWGGCSLFNLTGGHVILLRVKVTPVLILLRLPSFSMFLTMIGFCLDASEVYVQPL